MRGRMASISLPSAEHDLISGRTNEEIATVQHGAASLDATVVAVVADR